MVDILENRADWTAHFEANFLKHYHETGETNFKVYQYSRNESGVAGKAIDLSQSRLVFITTAGGYLKDSQEAYDAPNPLGDYSLRTFPVDTPLNQLAFAHTHYNHKFVDDDPQVLMPLKHLADMVSEGKIGELAPQVIAFSGYMPDVSRILDEVIPQVVGMAKDQQADAALLVPA
jgi:D-proline reductase (dithiol) PrdB